ncbi:hypothetical protein G9P44_002458 [Scheffersomyces stipitis]|nr:hypothetical protein G9P44_002458 [Scheffersomyces stipitis]
MAGGIRKKTSLRDKSSRKSGLASKISEFKQQSTIDNGQDEHFHENPLLKLSKISKKEKQQQKTDTFNQKLLHKVTFNTSSNISKSAVRRRKRKEKEQLKPKMDELLTSLPDDMFAPTAASTTTIRRATKTGEATSGYVKSTKANLNLPNANKATGHKQILKQENKNFTNVLKNPEFRQSPFSALKNAIKENLQG